MMARVRYFKASFIVHCTKMQLITSQNFNIQTCFRKLLWFFSLPNAYKLCVLIEMSMEIGMLKFLGCDPGLFACAMVHETHFSVGNITFYVKGRGLS